MSNEVKQGRTLSGKTNYTVTVQTPIGNTTYVRTSWSDIIEILKEQETSTDTKWYGEGRYMGD